VSALDALRSQIERIDPVDQRESDSIVATLERLEGPGNPFAEDQSDHHLTASAFVVSSRGVVLHRHRLLGIWVQPGGHVDANEGPESAALRETLEETGLVARHLDPVELFHVDLHPAPGVTPTTTCATSSSPHRSIRRRRRMRVPRSTGSTWTRRKNGASPRSRPRWPSSPGRSRRGTCETENVSETDDLRALMEADRWLDRVGPRRRTYPRRPN